MGPGAFGKQRSHNLSLTEAFRKDYISFLIANRRFKLAEIHERFAQTPDAQADGSAECQLGIVGHSV